MRERYETASGFRVGLNARLRAVAKERRRPVNELQREFLLQRFLARVFAKPDRPWILKGGTGLLIRMPGARHTQDIDLLYPRDGRDVDKALTQLRERADEPQEGDFLRYEIGEPRAMTGQAEEQISAKVPVACYLGAIRFGSFPVDLSMKLRTVTEPDLVRPEPVVEMPGLADLPAFSLYPLPDQIADKVCAMYGRYRVTNDVSSRYHDLVDLALIITTNVLSAEPTMRAIHEESARRPGLLLPGQMISPGPGWATGYRTVARGSLLPADLHSLDAAMAVVGECLNPLLQRRRRTGVWNPVSGGWSAG
jgi:hypothetical protein